jgi:hypothetical protein
MGDIYKNRLRDKYENVYLSREDTDDLIQYLQQNCYDIRYNMNTIIFAVNRLIDNGALYTKEDYNNQLQINQELENRLYNKKMLTSE